MTDREAQVRQAEMIGQVEREMDRLRPQFPDLTARALRDLAADSLDAEMGSVN